MKYIIWIKEKRGDKWEEQGDGPLSSHTAERIAREIRHLCYDVRIVQAGLTPVDL